MSLLEIEIGSSAVKVAAYSEEGLFLSGVGEILTPKPQHIHAWEEARAAHGGTHLRWLSCFGSGDGEKLT